MSPRTPQQFKEMREEKMTLIMDVALEHFANEGFYGTTISHIARHAGISKGLMYNYFESKEALLKAIIHKSVNEINRHFDIDRDGHLSEEEFEYLLRKSSLLLKEKRSFWRLLMQMLIQNDVREQVYKLFQEPDSLIHPGHEPGDNFYPLQMKKLITEYFNRKKKKTETDPDTENEVTMFFITMMGFAFRSVYLDSGENDRAIEKIIELYK